MPNINITVAGKIATNMSPGVVIICGNSDYTVTFSFDDEWNALPLKTARFIYTKGGRLTYTEVPFVGNEVAVPVLSDITDVFVGVYAGDLHTTTPARVLTKRSTLCGLEPHKEPDEDVYLQVLALIEEGRVQGPIGPPGIHIGSKPPTDRDIMAWIDPNGTPSTGGTGSGIESIEIEAVGFDGSDDGGSSGNTVGKDGVGITNITITEV